MLGFRVAVAVYAAWALVCLVSIASNKDHYYRCECGGNGEHKVGGACLCGAIARASFNCHQTSEGPCFARTVNRLLSSTAVYAVVFAPIAYRILYHVGSYKSPALLTVLLKRFGVYVVASFLRSSVYLIAGMFASRFSDHLVLHGMLVSMVGYELSAFIVEPQLETAQRAVGVVYCVLAVAAVCANSASTALYFHTAEESAIGLLVAGAFVGPFAVLANRGAFLNPTRKQ